MTSRPESKRNIAGISIGSNRSTVRSKVLASSYVTRIPEQFASFNEHTISIREEPVFLRDGMLVGAQDIFPSREGRDQHHQRGPGQVKVGQQTSDDSKPESRINK